MRISDWSSDVCSSDLLIAVAGVDAEGDERGANVRAALERRGAVGAIVAEDVALVVDVVLLAEANELARQVIIEGPDLVGHGDGGAEFGAVLPRRGGAVVRSDEHTSELQSLMRTSYAVFCLTKQH